MRRRLLTTEDAVPAKGQHVAPCSDCPWARVALPGWLGGSTADAWLAAAHGEGRIACHVLAGAQCAGAAAYRANVCKLPKDPAVLRLPADRVAVFATPAEFSAHHRDRDKSRFLDTPAEAGSRPETSRATEGLAGEFAPPQTQGETKMATNAKDLKAAHVIKVNDLKAKHAAALDKAVIAKGKAVEAAEKKGTAKAAKLLGTIEAVDVTALGIIDALNGGPAGIAKAKKLADLIRTKCDKHLV